MFQAFSDAYYLGELYVEPHDGKTAVMQQTQHESVNKQLYVENEGVERVDAPLVMKLNSTHFPVTGGSDIPSGTLAVPTEILEDIAAGARQVFLADRHRAMELLRYAGWQPPTGE